MDETMIKISFKWLLCRRLNAKVWKHI